MAERTLSVTNELVARHEVEETLHATLYPGTEIMTDGTVCLLYDYILC